MKIMLNLLSLLSVKQYEQYKKTKCAIWLNNSFSRFRCPVHTDQKEIMLDKNNTSNYVHLHFH